LKEDTAFRERVEVTHLDRGPDVRESLIGRDGNITSRDDLPVIGPDTKRDTASGIVTHDDNEGGFDEFELSLIASGGRTPGRVVSRQSFEDNALCVFGLQLVEKRTLLDSAEVRRHPGDSFRPSLREEIQQVDDAPAIGLRGQVIVTPLQEVEDMQDVPNRLAIEEVITRKLQGRRLDGFRDAALQIFKMLFSNKSFFSPGVRLPF